MNPIMDEQDEIDLLKIQIRARSRADLRLKQLAAALLSLANECNCRAEHGADGAIHLLNIEKRLRKLAE